MKRILIAFASLLLAGSTWAASIRTAVTDMVISASSTSHTFTFPTTVTNGDLLFIMCTSGSTPTAVSTTGTVTSMTQAYTNTSDPMGIGLGVFAYTVTAASGMTGISATFSADTALNCVIGGVQDSDQFSAAGFRTGTFSDAVTRVDVTTLTTDEVAVGLTTVASSTSSTLTPDSGNAQLEVDSTNFSYYSTTGLGSAGSKTIGGLLSGAEFGWGWAITFRNASGGGGGGGGAGIKRTLLGAG